MMRADTWCNTSCARVPTHLAGAGLDLERDAVTGQPHLEMYNRGFCCVCLSVVAQICVV